MYKDGKLTRKKNLTAPKVRIFVWLNFSIHPFYFSNITLRNLCIAF